ncbi:MAG: flagellar biosynthesis protein FliQ [Desulfurivibrionaceae bacterium]
MSPMQVVSLGQDAVMVTLMVAAPLLGTGMAVGLIVALFMATTQIQEMTLTFVPKIISVLIALIVFGSWMLIKLVDYTRNLFESIPTLVG